MLAILLLCGTNCAEQVQQSRTEEIIFRSGPFRIVGDLRLPEGAGPYPLVVFVHGDGPNDRTGGGTYLPIMARMARAGYATFAWDKPGTGESIGEIDRTRLGEQRAQIVLDAIEMLKRHPDVDRRQIGLWGISQAGYVMPRVLLLSEDVVFMIAVSCPGTAGVDQGAYLVSAQAACAGVSREDAEQIRHLVSAIERVPAYEEYVYYKEALDALPGMESAEIFGYRKGIMPEEEWHVHDPANEYFWNPMDNIQLVRIPVLGFFGERDTQVDPIQGAQAYRAALERAGNPHFRIVIIAGADHQMILSETGCLDEQKRRPRSEWSHYAPEYLDTLEAWLQDLNR